MTGWQRLKIVLSVIYWLVAGFLAWGVGFADTSSSGSFDWGWTCIVLAVAGVFYAMAAALWWALAGFSPRGNR